jgi:hypothetical protein
MDLQRHATARIRHELRRRMLTVSSSELLTPRMRRFGFTSPELHDFVSAAHDDHVKLFFPAAGNDADGRDICMRDFTPRRFDNSSNTLSSTSRSTRPGRRRVGRRRPRSATHCRSAAHEGPSSYPTTSTGIC